MSTLDDNLELAFNAELSRRLLIKYFFEKGFSENFDRKVYPLLLQDIAEVIPEFTGKVEVTPHAIDIDPQTGFAKLGWNMFVLGHHRMYLGETEHVNVQDLAQQLESGTSINESGDAVSRQEQTPRKITAFITRVLRNNQGGLLRGLPMDGSPMPAMAAGQGQNMYERPKAIRPEGGGRP